MNENTERRLVDTLELIAENGRELLSLQEKIAEQNKENWKTQAKYQQAFLDISLRDEQRREALHQKDMEAVQAQIDSAKNFDESMKKLGGLS